MLKESLSQLPLVRAYPAPHAGDVALPVLPAPIVAGAELCVVHCSAVASDKT
jgi:hypothetical protein